MDRRDKDWYSRTAKRLAKTTRDREELHFALMKAGQEAGKPYDRDVIEHAADKALNPELHKRPKQGYGWG